MWISFNRTKSRKQWLKTEWDTYIRAYMPRTSTMRTKLSSYWYNWYMTSGMCLGKHLRWRTLIVNVHYSKPSCLEVAAQIRSHDHLSARFLDFNGNVVFKDSTCESGNRVLPVNVDEFLSLRRQQATWCNLIFFLLSEISKAIFYLNVVHGRWKTGTCKHVRMLLPSSND